MSRDLLALDLFQSIRGGTPVVWTNVRHRPAWMSDTKWDQMVAYMQGQRIPTDETLLAALCGANCPPEYHRYIYTAVPGCMVLEAFASWCELIAQHTVDPDLQLPEGL
jgi:hypothetical protein